MPQKGLAISPVKLGSPFRAPANPAVYREVSEDNSLFRKIFLSSNDAIVLLTTTGGEFLDLNPRASVIFGYPRHEFLQLPPRGTIFIHKDQWELLLDSVSNRRDKWLRRMGCRQKSGQAISCDILPSVVQVSGTSRVLAILREARQWELAELLRANARFMRFSNAVATGAAASPSIEHAIRFCLRQTCDYAHWVFAHAHIFSEPILTARVPADIWHFGLHELARSIQETVATKGFVFPEEWYVRILAGAQAVTVDNLEAQPEFLAKLGVPNSGLSSALAVPILIDNEVAGVCQYFSSEPMNRGQLFVDMMANLAARLGQIIEQKQADENVRNLSAKLFRAQDEERRQLARELHDTTAQNVAAILMDLGVISRSANALPPAANQALSESLTLAKQSLHEIRSFSYLIHPPMLDELGLVSALRIFIEGFSQRSGMHVHLDVPDACPKLPPQLDTTLFRVVQEALTNARRHSGSSTAEVKLRMNQTELRLSVENETTADFVRDKTDLQPAKLGVGMRSMQERVQHFGGRLDFHMGKNRTILEALIPLSQAAREQGNVAETRNPGA